MSAQPSRHVLLKEFRRRIDPGLGRLGAYERLPSKRGRRVTQEELADAIGVSRVWYAMLESSADVRPSPILLDRLAGVLTISPAERAALFYAAIPELRMVHEPMAASARNDEASDERALRPAGTTQTLSRSLQRGTRIPAMTALPA